MHSAIFFSAPISLFFPVKNLDQWVACTPISWINSDLIDLSRISMKICIPSTVVNTFGKLVSGLPIQLLTIRDLITTGMKFWSFFWPVSVRPCIIHLEVSFQKILDDYIWHITTNRQTFYCQDESEAPNRWVQHFTSPENRHALPLFTSLLNVVCAYDPVGLGLPYNHLLFTDSREPLVESALQLLIVTLDWDSCSQGCQLNSADEVFHLKNG